MIDDHLVTVEAYVAVIGTSAGMAPLTASYASWLSRTNGEELAELTFTVKGLCPAKSEAVWAAHGPGLGVDKQEWFFKIEVAKYRWFAFSWWNRHLRKAKKWGGHGRPSRCASYATGGDFLFCYDNSRCRSSYMVVVQEAKQTSALCE